MAYIHYITSAVFTTYTVTCMYVIKGSLKEGRGGGGGGGRGGGILTGIYNYSEYSVKHICKLMQTFFSPSSNSSQ